MDRGSNDITAALRQRYCEPEWALFFEVADATGGRTTRRADAMAMNLWPSRGLAMHGFEIKVHRYDWLREMRNPAKAEVMARYCDFWWLVAPTDIITKDEVPETWGLLSVNGRGQLRQVVAAHKAEAIPLDRPIIASLLRSAGNLDAVNIQRIVDARMKQFRASIEDQIAVGVDHRTKAFAHDSKLLESCRTILGSRMDWLAEEDFARAVALVVETGVAGTWGGLNTVADNMEKYVERIRGAAKKLGIPVPAKAPDG